MIPDTGTEQSSAMTSLLFQEMGSEEMKLSCKPEKTARTANHLTWREVRWSSSKES